MKTHEFRLVVKTEHTRKGAMFRVLSAFAKRQPDACQFWLKNLPSDSATKERAALKRKVQQLIRAYDYRHGLQTLPLEVLSHWLNTRTKRTAARKGLGRKG